MNLELPFSDLSDAEFDAYLARIDAELDALFLDDVQQNLEAIRAGKATEAREVPASAA